MWKKVTDKTQLESLQTGDALIKYPIKGEPKDSFDDANPDTISPRVVSVNADEVITLGSLFSDRKNDPILGMYKSVFGPVEKTYDELISDNYWWVFES